MFCLLLVCIVSLLTLVVKNISYIFAIRMGLQLVVNILGKKIVTDQVS